MRGRASTEQRPRSTPSTRQPDRKQAIAHESARLFAERGFSAVGMDDIGAAAGITGPAIYRHFAGKDAILEEVIVSLLEEFGRGAVTAEGDLAELVSTSVSSALDHPAEVATYVRERGRMSGTAARRASTLERKLRGLWADALRGEASELSDAVVFVRQQAVLGVMGSMTLQRGGVARPRLDELLVEGSLRMLRTSTRQEASPPGAMARPTEWQPQASRREAILNAALTLMRTKGFHGVGIDEIGDAAGISGPAVYRHYASKADILLDAYDRVGSRVAVGVEAALASATGPSEALDKLIESYVSIALDNVDLIIATGQEGAALPPAERPRLARQQRAIAESWSRVVAELRPDLSEGEVRRHVASVFPMVNHVARLRQIVASTPRDLQRLVRAFLVMGGS